MSFPGNCHIYLLAVCAFCWHDLLAAARLFSLASCSARKHTCCACVDTTFDRLRGEVCRLGQSSLSCCWLWPEHRAFPFEPLDGKLVRFRATLNVPVCTAGRVLLSGIARSFRTRARRSIATFEHSFSCLMMSAICGLVSLPKRSAVLASRVRNPRKSSPPEQLEVSWEAFQNATSSCENIRLIVVS